LSSRDKGVIERMLGDWAGVGNDDNGVSIENAFANYDRSLPPSAPLPLFLSLPLLSLVCLLFSSLLCCYCCLSPSPVSPPSLPLPSAFVRNHDGTIDPSEFEYLLHDLGVEVTEERLNEAFVKFDENKDGKISFDEFSKWWRRDDVSYTLKRSHAIEPTVPSSINGSSSTELSRSRAAAGAGAAAGGTGGGGGGSTSMAQRSKTPTRLSREGSFSSQQGLGLGQGSGQGQGQGKGHGKGQGVALLEQNIAMPLVSYHGTATKNIEISGLDPNSLYLFKLRYVGSRSNSSLSSPLVLMTTPAPPDTPLLIYLSPTCVRIKWYPPLYGAYKYAIQIKNMSPSYASAAFTLGGGTGGGGGAGGGGGLASESDYNCIFIGQENYWMSTTLTPDTMYAVRVVGINAQGQLGVPSTPLSFRTYPRDETKHLISSRNINDFFSIECTGDICVGDTILLTERLYHRSKSVIPSAAAAAAAAASGSGSGSRQKNSGGVRGSNPGPPLTKSGVQAGTSVYSLTSTGQGGYLITGDGPDPGNYIGERTIAAHVIKDNYKTTRIALNLKDLTPTKFHRTRRLWLEVIWQKASNENCKPYELRSGEVIERMGSHIEQFEVFRSVWLHEKLRRPLREDLKSLSDCFLHYPC
jgi:hypothetical protein